MEPVPRGLCPLSSSTHRSWERCNKQRQVSNNAKQTQNLVYKSSLQADTQPLFLDTDASSRAPSLPLQTQGWSEPRPGELQGLRIRPEGRGDENSLPANLTRPALCTKATI